MFFCYPLEYTEDRFWSLRHHFVNQTTVAASKGSKTGMAATVSRSQICLVNAGRATQVLLRQHNMCYIVSSSCVRPCRGHSDCLSKGWVVQGPRWWHVGEISATDKSHGRQRSRCVICSLTLDYSPHCSDLLSLPAVLKHSFSYFPPLLLDSLITRQKRGLLSISVQLSTERLEAT